MRIAFLTRDYQTESGGGLASFLNRTTRLIKDLGHEPEVFVRSEKTLERQVLDFYGIRVERVPSLRGWPMDLICWLAWRAPALRFIDLAYELAGARDLAERLEVRHAEKPFDAVHCSAWGATALFVPKIAGRRLVTRFCWPRMLMIAADGDPATLEMRLLARLERRAAARSDAVYAPSRLVADHLEHEHGIPALTLRPPAWMEQKPAPPAGELPSRYLLHFGGIGRRKGSDVVANALPLAWKAEPELTMIWAGKEQHGRPLLEEFRRIWGENADQVIWLREVEKSVMYGLIAGAIASVIPTRYDNLPNTAIESLLLGTPVIGTRGASIDEIVAPGDNGELTDIGDVAALADAMVRAWRGQIPFISLPDAFESMLPASSAKDLLAVLSGSAPSPREKPARRLMPSDFCYVPRLPPPSLRALYPSSTGTGCSFNLQPDGRSALAVDCENAGIFTTIVFDGVPLETTFGSSTFLTALVPAALIARPAIVRIQLRDEMSGDSNTIEFPIEA